MQARGGGHRRHEAHQPEPRGRHPRRGGLVALARRGADRAGQQGADDLALVDQPAVTQIGDYIFRVCFIDPFQGAVMAQVRRRHPEGQEGRDPQRRAAATTRSGLPDVLHARPSSSWAARSSREQSYSEGDTDFRAQLTAIKARNPEAIFVPGYYTEVGHDRAPGARARHHGAAARRRRLGLAQAAARSAARRSNGCYFSNHYSRRRPEPGGPEVRRPTTRRSYGADARTRSPPSATTRPRSWSTPSTRAGSHRRAPRCATRIAATKDFPGVTGTITIDADRNAGEAGRRPQGRGRQVR